jgi:hypothetical protein
MPCLPSGVFFFAPIPGTPPKFPKAEWSRWSGPCATDILHYFCELSNLFLETP